MTLQQDVEVLKNIPLFAKIEPAKLKLLVFTSEHIEFQPGDFLCRQGDAGDAAFIVLDGSAEITVDAASGALKVATIDRNDIVGEIAILCDVPRTASVRATSRVLALRISKDGFLNLVTQFPQIAVQVMQELAARLNNTTQRLSETVARLHAAQSRP